MYLDMTYGQLRLDDMTLWQPHFNHWPKESPLVVHAESRSMAAALLFAALYERPIHIAHVSTREEILTIRAAKERGIQVTCEVAPHHLFLSEDDFPALSHQGRHPGRQEVRPRLSRPAGCAGPVGEPGGDRHLRHRPRPPHPAGEGWRKPAPGFPGLETILPLLLTAVHEGRLTLEDVITRMHDNPRRIFNLPPQPQTWVEIDPQADYEIRAAELLLTLRVDALRRPPGARPGPTR